MHVPLAPVWVYLQNHRALIQLEEKLWYKFVNYLCVIMQANSDFVRSILQCFDLRKLPTAACIHFREEHSVLHLTKPSIPFTCSLQLLECWREEINRRPPDQAGREARRQPTALTDLHTENPNTQPCVSCQTRPHGNISGYSGKSNLLYTTIFKAPEIFHEDING